MPIPGDNGHPREERDAQNIRITHVAERGADVKQEVFFNPPPKKEKNIFGVM